MTREEIIRMVRESGAVYMDENANEYIYVEDLPKIAALVAAAEREAILKILESEWFRCQADVEAAIKARGQA